MPGVKNFRLFEKQESSLGFAGDWERMRSSAGSNPTTMLEDLKPDTDPLHTWLHCISWSFQGPVVFTLSPMELYSDSLAN